MGRFTEILKDSAPTGSVLNVNIVNGSIAVDVTVADYVSVTQSGAFLTILGSVNVNNNTAGSVMYMPAGSVTVTNNVLMTGSVTVSNPPYLGSTYTISGTQIVLGSVAVTNNVPVTGSVAVTNTVNIKDLQYYPSATSTKFSGIHIACSGLASGTAFSGLTIADGARYLSNITCYGGFANDDVLNVTLSGAYVASGIWTNASSSHSFNFDTPLSWPSGTSVIASITNNTAKTASVNASVKWLA